MKVSELIQKLHQVDPNLEVVIRGYEGGVNKVENISKPLAVAENFYQAWYYGKHEVVDVIPEDVLETKRHRIFTAVYLGGE